MRSASPTTIKDFIEARLREYNRSPSPEMLRLLSTLERIAGVHRESSGNPGCCAYDSARWPCMTIRDIARTWLDHPDFDPEWDFDNTFGPYGDVHQVARELWGEPTAKDWMLSPNDRLDGARPADVIRLRGPEDVLAALDAEAHGATAG